MKYTFILLILIPILTANNCISSKKNGKTKSDAIRQPIIKNVIVDKKMDFINYKKEFTIKTATIADSTVSITFTYTGCGDDDINLMFNGNYLKSYPPKATLYLIKTSDKKDCGKLMEKTLLFNISPVKYPNAKTLVIQFPDYESKLMYNY